MAREGGRSGQKTALRSRKSIAGNFSAATAKGRFPAATSGGCPCYPPARNGGKRGRPVHGTFAGTPGRTQQARPFLVDTGRPAKPWFRGRGFAFSAAGLLLLRDVEVGDGAVVDLGRHAHRFA